MGIARVNVIVNTIPHPDPVLARDIVAKLIVKELLKNEEKAQ